MADSFFSRFKLFGTIAILAGALAVAPTLHADPDPDPGFDRMDGTGASGKTVQVIEWEGNLEIHVMPKGSLKGLALKLDERTKDRSVMVIGYRFDSDPGTQQIRRAILGIDLRGGLRAYRDRSAAEYDKIVISGHPLAGPELEPFRLEPAPTQLYPDGVLAPSPLARN